MKAKDYGLAMAEAHIDAGIADIAKRSGTLNQHIQFLAVSILASLKKHGDKPTAQRRANALVKALGKGLRQKSLLGWFEQHAPMVYNKETKELVMGVTAANPVKTVQAIDPAAANKVLWHDAVPEAEYQPIADWNKQLMALVKRAKQDMEKMGEKSKVNPEQLAMLERMANG